MSPAEIRSSCLDPETLAAWTDGGLTRDEIASLETHAATCARCQAMLAAMAKTAPPVQAAAAPSWRRFLIPALVPLTAIIVLAMWVAVPQRDDKLAEMALPKAAPAARDRELAADNEQAQAANRADKNVAARSAPAVAQKPAAVRERQTFAAPPPPPPAAAPTAAAAASPALERRSSEQLESARQEVIAQRPAGAALDVIAENRSNNWRVINGRVERSTDQGKTWTAASVNADLSLTALSSPSPNVCWAVGNAGVVAVTSDGTTWRLVRVPKTVDLVSVVGSDAKNAFVTAANGTIYTTADGGQTWEERQP